MVFFIAILFLINVFTAIGVVAHDNREINKLTPRMGDIIVVGIMRRIDGTEEYKDYEVNVAVIIDNERIEIIINKEDTLRLYSPWTIEISSVVVAFCEDWERIS